jgi:hypothetical protein
MPERLYRDGAAPPQRDLARQIHHAASVAGYIVEPFSRAQGTGRGYRRGAQQPGRASSLRDGVWRIAHRSGAERSGARGNSRPGQKMPAWQVWDEIYTHTVWTAGSIVANFRKNGMAPPIPFSEGGAAGGQGLATSESRI